MAISKVFISDLKYGSCSSVTLGCWSTVKDLEGEDVLKSEFCADIFDNVRLGYHIDEEHPVKAKNGVNNNHQTLLLECYADRCYVFGDMICLTFRFCSVGEKNGIDTHRRFCASLRERSKVDQ
ncbi:hypothetical protein Rs2_34286 [Raphanus sativus]|nr:hypothetical protein Rs2_34286 [Raphanus sativus]